MPHGPGSAPVVLSASHPIGVHLMPTVYFAGKSVECPEGANLRTVLLRARLPLYNGVARAIHCRFLSPRPLDWADHPSATRVAGYYRKKGYFVVAGGSYASLCPESYDSVAVYSGGPAITSRGCWSSARRRSRCGSKRCTTTPRRRKTLAQTAEAIRLPCLRRSA